MKKRYVLSILAVVLIAGCIAGFIWGRRKEGPSGPTPDEMVKELLEFDRNSDGQLSPDEVPERMQGLFARGDANKDGVLSQDELLKLAQAQSDAARRNEHSDRHEGNRR
ncbi:MAG: hypothetical protein KA368_22075 [Acidobacteria bacterium]|nr:hypothetical protein [Acidobacteriota bacterium]